MKPEILSLTDFKQLKESLTNSLNDDLIRLEKYCNENKDIAEFTGYITSLMDSPQYSNEWHIGNALMVFIQDITLNEYSFKGYIQFLDDYLDGEYVFKLINYKNVIFKINNNNHLNYDNNIYHYHNTNDLQVLLLAAKANVSVINKRNDKLTKDNSDSLINSISASTCKTFNILLDTTSVDFLLSLK